MLRIFYVCAQDGYKYEYKPYKYMWLKFKQIKFSGYQ
jgi:hypothetical protein